MLAFLLIIGLFLFRYSLGENTVLGVILPSKSLKFEYSYPRFRVFLLIKKGCSAKKIRKSSAFFQSAEDFFVYAHINRTEFRLAQSLSAIS